MLTRTILLGTISLLCLNACAAPKASDYFAIEVIDEDTGRGVPLVEFETVNNLKFVTDSAGVLAFYEPGLMDTDVFFTITSHGYQMQKDMFGYAGKVLRATPGKTAQIKLKRVNIAERMYRVTGAGIYADSVMLGRKSPIKQPLLNAQVCGQDSIQPAVYKGQIYWFWGDTNRPGYMLGSFHTCGARSKLPGAGGLDPKVGVDLEYFGDGKGFIKRMMPMPEDKPGPVWTDAVFVLKDDKGVETLVAHYTRVKDIATRLQRGIMIFNDKIEQFEEVLPVPLEEPLGPQGQAFATPVMVDGVPYQYFCHWGPPNIRVKANLKDVLDLSAYEAFTPLAPGTVFKGKDTQLERKDGKLVWAWKKGTGTLGTREQKELIAAGLMTGDESPHFMRNVEDSKPVTIHSASVYFNNHRKKWVMIALETEGTSVLGEVWYAEANSIEGPWTLGRKVVTHDRYCFYNPRLHPYFEQDGGRFIFFEGTFANSISGVIRTTARYEYNQVMYRLDLDDPRLRDVRRD